MRRLRRVQDEEKEARKKVENVFKFDEDLLNLPKPELK